MKITVAFVVFVGLSVFVVSHMRMEPVGVQCYYSETQRFPKDTTNDVAVRANDGPLIFMEAHTIPRIIWNFLKYGVIRIKSPNVKPNVLIFYLIGKEAWSSAKIGNYQYVSVKELLSQHHKSVD